MLNHEFIQTQVPGVFNMIGNKISVYLNSRASSVEKVLWKKEIENQLFRSELLFRSPETLERLDEMLEEDLENKVNTIISIGGDGTVHTLIQKLAGKDVSLLVLPAGTANDLAVELGQMTHIRQCVWCIRLNKTKKMDLIKINDRYMATNGGLGIAGEVAFNINRLRKKFPFFKKIMKTVGKSIYAMGLGKEWIFSKVPPMELLIKCDKFAGMVRTHLLMINNQPSIAGRFNIAPKTENDDGFFNVTIFKHQERLRLLKAIMSFSMGKFPHDDPDLITFETKKIRIENVNEHQELHFFGDGEVFRSNNVFDIEIQEKALSVYKQAQDIFNFSYNLEEEDEL